MIIVLIILAIISIVLSIIALFKKKSTTIKEKVVEVVKAPVEHPFTYDSDKGYYILDGTLVVTEGICLYNNNVK